MKFARLAKGYLATKIAGLEPREHKDIKVIRRGAKAHRRLWPIQRRRVGGFQNSSRYLFKPIDGFKYLVVQRFASGCGDHAADSSLEERRVHGFFQGRKLLANRGLSQVTHPGGR